MAVFTQNNNTTSQSSLDQELPRGTNRKATKAMAALFLVSCWNQTREFKKLFITHEHEKNEEENDFVEHRCEHASKRLRDTRCYRLHGRHTRISVLCTRMPARINTGFVEKAGSKHSRSSQKCEDRNMNDAFKNSFKQNPMHKSAISRVNLQ